MYLLGSFSPCLETIDDLHILACLVQHVFPIVDNCRVCVLDKGFGTAQSTIDNREIHGLQPCISTRTFDGEHRASCIGPPRHDTRHCMPVPDVASCWRMGS
jgi:hypothetical protein